MSVFFTEEKSLRPNHAELLTPAKREQATSKGPESLHSGHFKKRGRGRPPKETVNGKNGKGRPRKSPKLTNGIIDDNLVIEESPVSWREKGSKKKLLKNTEGTNENMKQKPLNGGYLDSMDSQKSDTDIVESETAPPKEKFEFRADLQFDFNELEGSEDSTGSESEGEMNAASDAMLYYNIVTTKRESGKRKIKPRDYVMDLYQESSSDSEFGQGEEEEGEESATSSNEGDN